MPTKTVYSIRVPVELRKMVEELVKNKSRERLLADAKEIRKAMKADVSAAELIREDRDAR
jgi:hypothetical protein